MNFLLTVFAKGFTSVSINTVVLALCEFVPNERVFLIHLRPCTKLLNAVLLTSLSATLYLASTFRCNSCNVLLFSFFSVKTLEEMKTRWDQFGAAFESFSLWISEKEKQLDALKSSTLPLEQQINTVKVPNCLMKSYNHPLL